MKRLLLLLIIALPFIGFSQGKSGKITYGVQVDFEMPDIEGIPEEQMKKIRRRMERMSKQKKVLLFNEKEALFRNYDKEKDGEVEEVIKTDDGEMRMKFTMHRPDQRTYSDLGAGKSVQQKEFMGKKFLINDDQPKMEWKITGEQEMINKYPCQKATWQKNDSTLIEAWFAPQIPVGVGPAQYHGLPGAILKVKRPKMSLVAQEIEIREIKEGEITMPKEGKKVSQKKYDKIVEEKRKEMQEVYGKQSGGMKMMYKHE